MKASRTKPPIDIDLRPDGWERFEAAVDAAVGNRKQQMAGKPKTAKRSAPRKVRKRAAS
jgi:hypothetical protein